MLEKQKLLFLLQLLLVDQSSLSFKEPLGISLNLVGRDLLRDTALIGVVLPLLELLLVHLLVEPVHFAHLLDLVQVHHEAPLVSVILFDALSTEDGQVIGAVEVLDPLVMPVAKQAVDTLLIFKVYVSKNTVSFHDLIQDVEVKW